MKYNCNHYFCVYNFTCTMFRVYRLCIGCYFYTVQCMTEQCSSAVSKQGIQLNKNLILLFVLGASFLYSENKSSEWRTVSIEYFQCPHDSKRSSDWWTHLMYPVALLAS